MNGGTRNKNAELLARLSYPLLPASSQWGFIYIYRAGIGGSISDKAKRNLATF